MSIRRARWPASATPKASPRRPRVEREEREQRMLVSWARVTPMPPAPDVERGSKVLDYLFAIPNGGHRNKATASRLKAAGVKAGVSDLELAISRCGFHALFIELKADGGRPTASQLAWIDRMRRAGYLAGVCTGHEAAKRVILDYLHLRATDAEFAIVRRAA